MVATFHKKLEEIFSSARSIKYKKGQTVVEPGKRIDFIGLVKSGRVRIYTVIRGREITLPSFEMFFELTAMLSMTEGDFNFYAETLVPTEIVKIPVEDFSKYLKEENGACDRLIGELSTKFLEMQYKGLQQLGLEAIGKVAAMVLAVSQSRVKVPITHKLIGSLTGLTRETVTLQMLKLEKLGLIDNKNRRVEILKQKELEKLTNGTFDLR